MIVVCAFRPEEAGEIWLFRIVNEFQVRIGNIITHDAHSISAIPWKGITIYPRSEDPDETKHRVDKFSRELKSSLRAR